MDINTFGLARGRWAKVFHLGLGGKPLATFTPNKHTPHAGAVLTVTSRFLLPLQPFGDQRHKVVCL